MTLFVILFFKKYIEQEYAWNEREYDFSLEEIAV